MTADLLEASSDINRDLSPKWLELSARVRELAHEAGENSPLAGEALKLCDHVESLHADVEQFLNQLNDSPGFPEALSQGLQGNPPPEEIDKANLQIQREMHQKSDLQQIIKALFMWKDDPVERVRGKDH